MRNTGRLLTLALCLILAATLGLSMAGLRGDRQPHRYAPQSLDQEPVLAVNPVDGSVLSAWGYRESGEYSIALAVKTGEIWSEPVFIGRDDGLDQVDPALVFDSQGVAYLAFTVMPQSEVVVTAIAGRPEAALSPRTVSPVGAAATAPTLRVVADRLVVALLAGDRIVLRDLPLYRPDGSASTQGIQEGPDAVDPLIWAWQGNGKDSDEDSSGDRWESEEEEEAPAVPLALR